MMEKCVGLREVLLYNCASNHWMPRAFPFPVMQPKMSLKNQMQPKNQGQVSRFKVRECTNWASLVAQMVKTLPAMQETQICSWVRKIPWRRLWQPTPVFLSGQSHGQRSPVGYSPEGCK